MPRTTAEIIDIERVHARTIVKALAENLLFAVEHGIPTNYTEEMLTLTCDQLAEAAIFLDDNELGADHFWTLLDKLLTAACVLNKAIAIDCLREAMTKPAFNYGGGVAKDIDEADRLIRKRLKKPYGAPAGLD